MLINHHHKETISLLIKEVAPGKKVVDLCIAADNHVNERVKNLFKKIKKMPKGLAFPTSISVNDIVCHYSPLAEDTLVINKGDTVRFDVGVHVDGYIAIGATTVVLEEGTLQGEKADVLAAAQTALEVAKRLIKPGNSNTDVSKAFNQVASDFGVNLVEGVLSHELKRNVIDGNNVILAKPTADQTVDEFKFETGQVIALDILVSSGDGKLTERNHKTTIYKRNPEVIYNLKNDTSKKFLKEIQTKFDTLPFTLRALDRKIAGMGVIECYRHGLVDPYPVLCDKKGAFTVHLKTTLMLMPRETTQVVNVQVQSYQSTKALQNEDLKKLLLTTTKVGKKKAKKAATATTGEEMDISN
jgi:curved DNA binding protein